MSGLLRRLQFKQLKQRLVEANGHCPDLPLEALSDCAPPVDLDDPLVSSFLRGIRELQNLPGQDLSSLREMIVYLIEFQARLDGSAAMQWLDAMFDRLDDQNAGLQLDRLFVHMTGSSLSQTIDVSSILVHPDDHGLDGNNGFSLMLGVERPGMAATLIPVSAVASTLDFLLLLIKSAITEQADRYENFASNNDSPALGIRKEDYRRLKPTYLVIDKDDSYFTHLSVTKKLVNGYDINWASVLLSGHTRETVLSLAAIAPKAISQKMKGRNLEDELGL